MARRAGRSDADEPDPYEQAAARLEGDRRSRDLGDPIPVLPPGLATPLPDRRKMRRTLYLIGAVLLVLIIGRLTARSRSPDLAANCTKLQIFVDPGQVKQGAGVSWSATGGSGRTIAVRLAAKQVSRPDTVLRNCKATGKFLVPVPPGRYQLEVRDGTTSATVPLTVTS